VRVLGRPSTLREEWRLLDDDKQSLRRETPRESVTGCRLVRSRHDDREVLMHADVCEHTSPMIEQSTGGSEPGPQNGRSYGRRSNEDGPARLSIVARGGDRFTQRPDTLTRTAPSPMIAACGSGADHTSLRRMVGSMLTRVKSKWRAPDAAATSPVRRPARQGSHVSPAKWLWMSAGWADGPINGSCASVSADGIDNAGIAEEAHHEMCAPRL
jgi:hypothetical protein